MSDPVATWHLKASLTPLLLIVNSVLCDIVMPNLDGVTATSLIRQLYVESNLTEPDQAIYSPCSSPIYTPSHRSAPLQTAIQGPQSSP